MADQQRKVSLIFEANTNQAKNEINSLVQSLQKIQSMPRSLIDPTGIKEASKAAMELQSHIQRAINVDTGKLDLSRFATSLVTSGKSLEHYRNTLMSIGPAGNTAFQGVLRSINNAQVSTVRLTKGMQNFLTTMKNTVKWQISSSLMHGAISSIQQAIGYAKALDASLTNIRIVTGHTSDEMARFAVEANRAARALSTTTTKYTDAALIFYQQGLGDKAVKERTEAVMKMANVTGEAAADVSSYMTAIWNNFADGTKALEYYEDVITKLGASTAASSKEIAGGLEKFAAIGNTIGLSYEYATSMIATIVDKTRQSEDVVGTALKTILARIQGLNLGETLEDGTTLNKYSQALANVGVNIKDASGQLKDMDAILDELGAKWGTLSKDTQVALAQVVGGVRQYNQIISLMDHWGSFKNNVNLAETSSGTLEEQADIYAESWEAARNRVKAAAEGIYDALLDEKVFSQLDNLFTGLLNTIGGVVKGMGGMVPILATIGGFMTQRYAKEMPVLLSNIAQNFSALTGKSNNNAAELQKEATRQAGLAREASVLDPQAEAQYASLERVSKMREHLILNQRSLNSVEREELEMLIQNEQAIGDIMSQRGQSLKLVEQETEKLKEQIALQSTQAQLKAESQIDYTKPDGKGDKTSAGWNRIRQAEQEAFKKELENGNKEIAILQKKSGKDAIEQSRLTFLKEQRKLYGTGKGDLNQAALLEAQRRAEVAYGKEASNLTGNYINQVAQNKQRNILKNEFGDFLKSDSFKNAENQVEVLKTKFEALRGSLELLGAGEDIDNLDKLMKTLSSSTDLTEDQIKQLLMALDGIDDKGTPALQAIIDKMKELGMDTSDSALGKLNKTGNAVGAATVGNDRTPIGKLPEHKTGTAEVMASTASTLMSVYGTLNSLISLNTVLMDENASGLQKAGAIMGAVASILMTANSVMSFANTLKTIESVKLKQGITFKIADAVATKAEAAAEGTLTAAIWKKIAAWTAWMATNPIGWVLAIGAAVAGLAIALKSIDWRSEEQKKIDDLTEKVKALDKAQQNLAQHISDVESAWDGYQNAVDALEACTSGTEEWNKALLECNESLLTLMSLSPELAKMVQYNDDGSISLAGADYEEFIENKKRENSALIAQNTIASAEIEKTKLSDKIYGDSKANIEVSKYLSSDSGKLALEQAQESSVNLAQFVLKLVEEQFKGNIEDASKYLVDSKILHANLNDVKTTIKNGEAGNWNDIFINSRNMSWASGNLESNIATVNADWAKNISLYEGYTNTQKAANHTLLATLADYEEKNLGLYSDNLSKSIEEQRKTYLEGDSKKSKSELQQLMVDTFGGALEDYEKQEEASMAYSLAVKDVTSSLDNLNSVISSVNASLDGLTETGKSLARTGTLADVALNTLSSIGKANTSQEVYDSFGIQETGKTLKGLEYNTSKNLNTEYQEQLAVKRNEELRKINLSNLSNQIKAAKSYEEIVTTYDKEANAAAQGLELINSIYSTAENEKYAFSQEEQEELFRYDIMRAQLANASEEKNWYQSLFGLDSEKESLESSIKSIEEKFEGIADIQNRPILSEEAAFAAQAQGIISNWNPEDQSGALYKQLNDVLSNIEYTKDMTATPENISEIEVILDALANESVTKTPPGGYVHSSELQKKYNTLKKQGVYGESVTEEDFDSSEELKNWLNATFSEEDAAEILKENPPDISNYIPKEEYTNWVDNLYKTLGKDKFSEILNSLGTSLEEFNKGTEKEQYNTLNKNIFEINRALNSGKEALAAEILGVEDTARLFEAVLTEEQRTGTYAEQWGLIEEQVKKANPEEWYRQELLNATGAKESEYGIEDAEDFALKMNLMTQEEIDDAEIEIDWEYISILFNEKIIENMEAGLASWNNNIKSDRFKTNIKLAEDENGKAIASYDASTALSAVDKLFMSIAENGSTLKDIDTFATALNGITSGLDTKGFEDFSKTFNEVITASGDSTSAINAFKDLMEIYQTKGKIDSADISEVLDKNNIAGVKAEESLTALAGAIENAGSSAANAINSFDKLAENLGGLKKLLDITTGEEISEEDYESIAENLTDEQKKNFLRSAGGYTYIGSEEEAKEMEKIARSTAFDRYYNNRIQKQEAGEAARIEDSSYFKNDNELEDNLTNSNILSFLTESNRGLYNSNTQELFKLAGIDSGLIEAVKMADANGLITNGELSSEASGETKDAVAMMINAITAYLQGDFAGKTNEEAQLQATSMQSTDELDQAVAFGDIEIGDKEGQISKEQYDAIYNQKQLEEYETNFGLDKEELDDLGDTIQDMAESSKDAELGALGLSEALIEDAKAADEVAKELKRYDKALANVEDNYEDWQDALESDNLELQAEAVEEMDKAYSDLLDIDYDQLSNEFLTNKDNLKLLKEAAEGSEEAYNALQEAAGKDILMQVGLNTSKFDADKALIDAKLMEIEGKELEDIEVGASLNDQGFLDALTNMVNATGMSASQATDYLSSMGVDATVVENPVTTEEVVAHSLSVSTGVKTQAYTLAPTEPGGEAQRGVASYPIATYTAVPVTATKETGAVSLQVTSAGKSSGGGFKHANSSGGARRSRGGGGGGGGGGGSRAPQAEKKQSSDKERYHTVTNQLEDLSDAYDKVSKAADRAFGKSRIKLLREQQNALKDLAATQQDYIDEINDYYKQDLSNLDQVSQYVGFDVQLDENGTITNFDAIQDAMWDEYNSHINDKGEVTDMDEEAWKEYEKEWERIMALIEQYEETQDKRKEALQQLQDYINEIYDLQLEEITYAVEIDIEISDDKLEILDYLLSRIEDDAWKAAEAITYMGEQAATMLDKNNTYTSGIRDILMNHTEDMYDSEGRLLQKAQLTKADVEGFMSGDPEAISKLMGMNDAFTEEEIQKLRDYHSSLIEMNGTLIELREGVFDKVLDSFGQFNEEMDRSIDKIDHLSAVTDNYKNIIDIVGKKNLNVSNALLDSLNQASTEQRINRVEATRTKRDTIAAEITTAEAALADARAKGLEEDAKLWEKTLKEMRDSLDEAEEDFMQSWEDALDGIRQQFEEAVGHAVETLSDALAGPLMGSMEELQDAFDRQNTVAERYLPDYEKIYELNKLNRDITNSIDETDNIKAKQELAALQAEINALEESEAQISEYQMENLRRRYELKQAEIALTEAQDAKSQVQMSRDADGNWSYVYTANEDQVAEAEQTYEDRLFAMQEANAEYINAMNDSIIQLQAEMTQKIEEIMMDETLSAEEKMARVQEVTTFYQEQMNYYMDELELVLGENQVLYEEDWAKYSELTGYKISANEDYVDNFNETALSTLTGFQTMEEYQQNFNDAIGHPESHGLLYDLSQAYETWKNNTEAAMEAAGTSIQNFADDMAEDVDDIVDASEKATEEIEKMGDKVEQTFTDLTTAVQNWSNEYSATIDAILEKNTALAESFNKILEAYGKYKETTTDDSTGTPEEGTEENTDTGEAADEGNDVPDPVAEKTEKYKKGIAFAIWSHPSSGWGTGNSSSNLTSGKRYDRLKSKGLDPNTVQQQINAYRGKSVDYMKQDSGISFSKWSDRVGALNPYTYKKFAFDTGGYTGDWGEEGRWALLHSKEIVLNKDDTANLLSAVDMIRQISKAIDLNAYSSAGYGNSIIKAGNGMGGTLEQNVYITAEFPNATNREEIYSAFTDIINLASQYANRK
jgi:TP901 family phage tail tape measure protein